MKKLYQDSTFYLIIFIITYFIYVYPFEILSELIFNEQIERTSSLYYSLIISILIIFYFKSKNTFLALKLLVYDGMGVGFVSFWIMNIALIINYFFSIDEKILGLLSIVIIFLLLIAGFIFSQLIFLKHIKIDSKKISKNQNFIFISDIHLGSNSINHLNKILNKIDNLNYDFILIGGDLLDSSSFDINQLSILKTINKPIYLVNGNHEYYIFDYKKKLDKLKDFGITLLNNTNIKINNINLIGIDDRQNKLNQSNKALDLVLDTYFNLTLVHKPLIWDSIFNKIDLMLSGHTHGGQILPFNFFVRFQFKYLYGLYKKNNSLLYVTSGSGCWGPRLRIGTSNEIVYIKLNHIK